MDEPIIYFGGGGVSSNYPLEGTEEYYQILREWIPEFRLIQKFKFKGRRWLYLIKYKVREL